MTSRKPRLMELAARVSDGARVNWEQAERQSGDDGEKGVVRNFRILAGLADVHRSRSSSDAGTTVKGTTTRNQAGTPQKTGAGSDAQTEDDSLGKWGHLEILEKLGEGGYGEVFLAWDGGLERRVALKLLFRSSDETRATGLAAARAEGRLLAKVRHGNVVSVYGADEADGRVGIWMEYVRGRTLGDLLLEQGGFGAREATLIGIDLCRALAALHRAGLVHRDVKAQNVMRAEGGRILLMDLGVGRDLSRNDDDEGRAMSGTPLYMAPEILRGVPTTAQSDLYSLGVLLYHLVTGSFPIEADYVEQLREKHRRREARLLRDERPDLPEAFVKIVEKALAWDPQERFATAGQMERALATLIAGEGVAIATEARAERAVRMRPARLLGLAAAAVVVGAVVVGYIATREQRVQEVALADRSPAVSAAAYDVEASLYRVNEEGRRERLEQGARLRLGDQLSLEFRASRSVYLYVIDEDEAGHAYALFPLPDLDLKNPLSPAVTHRIPGARDGARISWKVTTPGGREHLLVLASPERLVEFEAEMVALTRPAMDRPPVQAVELPESARVKLRGIGGLVESADPGRSPSARPLFEIAEKLASRSEAVQGVWFRQIELENP